MQTAYAKYHEPSFIPGYKDFVFLGQGAFGMVYKGTDVASGEHHALKVIGVAGSAMNEIQALASLQHPNIVKYIGSIPLPNNGICIAMEYCSGGTLDYYLNANGQPDPILDRRYMKEIASAVAFLHSHGIVHRDLKPSNILRSANHAYGMLKVADFGLAKIVTDLTCGGNMLQYYMGTKCGTPYFVAPEVYSGHYTAKSDIFSMGKIFSCILKRTSDATKLLRPDLLHQISPETRTLVGKMHENSPGCRPTAAEVNTELCECRVERLTPTLMVMLVSGVEGWNHW